MKKIYPYPLPESRLSLGAFEKLALNWPLNEKIQRLFKNPAKYQQKSLPPFPQS